MAKLSSHDSDVLSEVPTHDTYLDNQVIDQSVQEMQYSKQHVFNNDTDMDITSESNIISYEQYLKETKIIVIQDTSSSAQQDALIMSVIEEMSNQVAKFAIISTVIVVNAASFIYLILRLYGKDLWTKIYSSTAPYVFLLPKQTKRRLMLLILVTTARFFINTANGCLCCKDLLIRYRSKRSELLNDLIKTVNESLTTELERYKDQIQIFEERKKFDLNDREKYINSQLREVIVDRNAKHFVKYFVPQKQLSAKQAFWLPISKPVSETPPVQLELVLKEIPRELPTISHAKEITDMKEVFTQMETKVDRCSVERKYLEIKEKELLLENDQLLELIISQDLVHTAVNSLDAIVDIKDTPKFQAFFEINDLKAQLEAKNNSISKLNDHIATLKGKSVSKGDKSKNISKVIAPGMYKLDVEPLSPKLLKNRGAHVDLLKNTQENANTISEIVKQDRALRPLDSDLESAFTPINKNKKVRFVELSTSSSNTQKHVDSGKTKDTNKPLFPSTRVISSTSASGSTPSGNTKKNRISRPTSSNKKNKVKDHLRSIKSSLNKKNRVYEPVCNANVKHSVLDVNSELICATCNECMFDTIHDLCVLDYLNDVNVHGRTLTIDENMCPLSRITSTTVVPPKKLLSIVVVKKTPPSSNNSGKLKDITNIDSSSKSKSVESKISNNSEPNKN
ncbi:hypothetical protein Tco_0729715 [Tanacetum coccineum]|uniref:Uncharacterized protein n=1 Tax=Tanacetum coccineum TaxID=301880 RepID=A0ABQ4YPM5_9ASTR